MIIIPPDDPSETQLWTVILELARLEVTWTLIGGQMVRVHSELKNRQPISQTADADVVADIRARPRAVPALINRLTEMGFVAAPGTGQYIKEAQPLRLKVDLLIPEGAGPRTHGRTRRAVNTVEVPGGTQAIQRTEKVSVQVGAASAEVPLPDLLGAIILKACACRLPTTAERDKHQRDLAFLLALVDDPITMRDEMTPKDRQRLRAVHELTDELHSAWLTLPTDLVSLGQSSLALLTSNRE